MIDTVGVEIHVPEHLMQQMEDQARPWGTRRYFPLKHRYGKRKTNVFLNKLTGTIAFEASIANVLSGHNVFGSNNLLHLIRSFMKLLYQRVDLAMTEKDWHHIARCPIEIWRLDLTASFRVHSEYDVIPLLNCTREHLLARGKKIEIFETAHGAETIYVGKRSSRITLKFYNKGLLLRVSQIPSDVPYREKIVDCATKLVRFEITMRRKELERLSLAVVSAWSAGKVRQMIQSRIAKFKFAEALKIELTQDVFNELSPRDQMVYRLWIAGANWRPYLKSERMLHQSIKNLLDHGVNIGRRPHPSESISLARVFSSENAYFRGPKGLSRKGAFI